MKILPIAVHGFIQPSCTRKRVIVYAHDYATVVWNPLIGNYIRQLDYFVIIKTQTLCMFDVFFFIFTNISFFPSFSPKLYVKFVFLSN